MIMTLDVLEGEIDSMLQAFLLERKKLYLVQGVSVQFMIPQFGLIVNGINRADYSMVLDTVSKRYPDWRQVYITTYDSIKDVKNEVLWELMKSGYMKWLRMEHPRSFQRLITTTLGDVIINRRLKLFGDKAKYAYLKELNEWAKSMAKTYVLSVEPGFFDDMVDE